MSVYVLSDNPQNGDIRIRITHKGRTTSYEISNKGIWKAFFYYDYGVTLEKPPFEDIKDLIRSEVIIRTKNVEKLRSEINILERLFDRIDKRS